MGRGEGRVVNRGWAEVAKGEREQWDRDGEYGDGECRGREDVTVDVMAIVGSVLRSGPTFFSFRMKVRGTPV